MEGNDMVRFEKDRYIIEVYTGGLPVEDYLDLQNEIIYMFSIINQENIRSDGFLQLANLLSAMLPDFEMAKKMAEK